MKKVFLLTVLLAFFFFGRICLAEEESTADFYQLYLKKFRLYQANSEIYNNAKSKYLSYQSVASRAQYLEEGKKYLALEIEAAEAYAVFIRGRLKEATNILNYSENLYFIKLDDEITSLSLLKEEVKQAVSIGDLLGFWRDFENHFQKIASYGYAIKSYIEIVSLEKVDENLKITKDKINQFLVECPPDNLYVKAAQDNFGLLEKDYSVISSFLLKLTNSKKGFTQDLGSKDSAAKIRGEFDQILVKIQPLISNYQKLLITVIQE